MRPDPIEHTPTRSFWDLTAKVHVAIMVLAFASFVVAAVRAV
jgi:hypothetical protein